MLAITDLEISDVVVLRDGRIVTVTDLPDVSENGLVPTGYDGDGGMMPAESIIIGELVRKPARFFGFVAGREYARGERPMVTTDVSEVVRHYN